MQDILKDLSPPTLVRAIKVNWMDYYQYLGRAPKAEWQAGPPLTWLLTGIPDTFNNVVLQTRLPANGADELISQALAHFRSRKIIRLSWWTEEGAPDTDLKQLLVAHGLAFNEGGTGMTAHLNAIVVDLPTVPGLTITPVESPELLKQWAHVVNIGFGHAEWSEKIWFELFADLAFELRLRSYLATLNGQPVGTSQLYLGEGVAGIYNVTCLPEARGRGVGAAITLAPLLEARKQGFHISILQASHLGQSVYRRLGFQEYGRLSHYRWENETNPK